MTAPLGRWEEEARRVVGSLTYGLGVSDETAAALEDALGVIRANVAQALADAERRTWERAIKAAMNWAMSEACSVADALRHEAAAPAERRDEGEGHEQGE